ncbi:MAG: hypothetical protein JO314_03070 [Acidobacteria bacterium]|nr:hypothetical protein [Acidobacteriota bacterium]
MNTAEADTTLLPTVRTLLEGAVDYAGLFPPSAVSMSEAVINYATYRNSNYSWMLGRFVVTSARLDEFYEHAEDFISRDAGNAWRLAVIIGDDFAKTIDQIRDFNARTHDGVICDVVEYKVATRGEIENAAHSVPQEITAYFELPLDNDLPELVAAVATSGQRAKIRTGGVTADAFPKSNEIVRFVRTCSAANVLFKATAGLHHPIRCYRPLTYEADAPKGTMHGFLNLFLMSGFARKGYKPNLLEEVMEEEFAEVFTFDSSGITWRGEYTLNPWQVAATRQFGIQAFGSCSFDEPVADLRRLGIL